MDAAAGIVLRALRDLDLEKDTIVVYTSDHGEMLSEHGLWQKFQFYESSCGVPFMLRAPGVSATGTCGAPFSQVSLLPTLAELCGVPVRTPIDGTSLVPQLRHPEAPRNEPVFAEYNLGNDHAKYMIRAGDYKYTFWTHDIAELYNLRTDSQEMDNLALKSEHAATVARLKAKLFAWYRPPETLANR